MHPLIQMLTGGDRRSIGQSEKVVAAVLADPALFPIVFDGMLADDPLVRMRCADAVEKITEQHPEWLRPHKKALLRRVAKIEQQEVRWHAAQLFPRLPLTKAERRAVVKILDTYLTDKSGIVRTFAMQALADLAVQDDELRAPALAQLEDLTRTGTSAMRSRGRKLLERLKTNDLTLFDR
jgi:HEAT repeat protein